MVPKCITAIFTLAVTIFVSVFLIPVQPVHASAFHDVADCPALTATLAQRTTETFSVSNQTVNRYLDVQSYFAKGLGSSSVHRFFAIHPMLERAWNTFTTASGKVRQLLWMFTKRFNLLASQGQLVIEGLVPASSEAKVSEESFASA